MTVAADHAATGSARQKPTWLSRQIRRARQSADGGLTDIEQPRHCTLRLATQGVIVPSFRIIPTLDFQGLGWKTTKP
jgi:hypothetical protein